MVTGGTLVDSVRDWSPIARFVKEEWKIIICMAVTNMRMCTIYILRVYMT